MAEEQATNATEALDKLYEFEREPVSEGSLQPGRHFAGLLAGEHVAGTEFVIGALFVSWGVRAVDIFIGLAIGNLMAVLTWAFICAPIAVRTRLTLYWYLRKIAGPGTTLFYNLWNALMFCILAGCMITVSASAVRIPFGIPVQIGWLPDDISFVVVVLAVGAVVVYLAICGFKTLAKFASVCSPWMFLMFMGGAVAILPSLGIVHSWADFWKLANESIWIGQLPAGSDRAAPMTFWQVAAFAWVCNLAMHGGLSDMAVFRYARKASYGFYSAFGMFFGHYMAWIFAGVMGAATALILGKSIDQLDAGAVANQCLGTAGILAVIIAGWTTSNPTIYRAGLAIQAIMPNKPRWLVTLLVGGLTTIVACSPFVFGKLLGFVGWYGLLLMPIGAVVFTEHWIFPMIGFKQCYATRKGWWISWPAMASWGIAIATSIVVDRFRPEWLFFQFVPIWIETTIIYIFFSSIAGARDDLPELVEEAPSAQSRAHTHAQSSASAKKNPMTPAIMACGIIAALCLVVCLIWPIMVFMADAENYQAALDTYKKFLLVPTIIYFITATVFSVSREKDA